MPYSVLVLSRVADAFMLNTVLSPAGIDIVSVSEDDLCPIGGLRASGSRAMTPDLKEAIAGSFKAVRFDLVIVGNNLGDGLERLPLIAREYKDHTLVLWNFLRLEEMEKYVSLGFKHHAERDSHTALTEKVRELLEHPAVRRV